MNSQVARGFALFLFSLSSIYVSGAAGLDAWEWRNPKPTGNALYAACFGANKFVVAGELGITAYSSDGLEWTTVKTSTTNGLYAITFGNALFVGVGAEGTIITSPDAVSWTARNSGTTSQLSGIAYGNGIFIAVGSDQTALVSTNGTNWTVHTVANAQPVDIAFGNNVFVAATASNSFATTADGATWASGASFGPGEVSGMVFGDGTFMAGGWKSGQFGFPTALHRTSTNGVDWVEGGTFQGNLPTRPVAFGNGMFVSKSAFTYETPVATSPDGSNWTVRTNYPAALSGGAFGNGTFLLVGLKGITLRSTDGVNWTGPGTSHELLAGIEYQNGVYVAAGGFYSFPAGIYGPVPGPTLLVSTNGRSFTPLTGVVSQPLSGISAGGGSFVVVGKGGSLYRSPDGLTWTPRPSSTTRDLHGITYGNGTFVAVGEEGSIVTSPNSLVWTLGFSGTGIPLYDVAYREGLYVAVGKSGTILTSPDAAAWTVQYTETTNAVLSVAAGSGIFVAVGQAGTILTSVDGVDWTPHVSGTSLELYSVTFGDGVFLVAGENGSPMLGLPSANVLLSSTNGVNWAIRNANTRNRLYAAAHLNGAYWLAGENGTILESSGLPPIQLFGRWDGKSNGFELTSTGGQLDRVYRVQSRTNLASDFWFDLATLSNGPAGIYFLDQDASLRDGCFYRLTSP